MKKLLLIILAFLLCAVTNVSADVFMPDPGPLYISFQNVEQISPTGTIVSPEGNSESNWGVFYVDTISTGNLSVDPQNFPALAPPVWSASNSSEITGIFYGLELVSAGLGDSIISKGGKIDFYYDDTPDAQIGSATPSDRYVDGLDNTFTNFTDGVLLASIEFTFGAIDPNGTVVGTATPTSGGFIGVASSYGDVVDINNDGVIDELDGAWAAIMDNEYFTTPLLGDNSADVKFRNTYDNLPDGTHSWDGVDASGNPIFGADSSDPARAYTTPIPEPGTMLLFGLGLLGVAGFSRRKNNS